MEVIRKALKYYKRGMPVFVMALVLGLLNIVILQIMPQIIQVLLDCVITPALGGEAPIDTSFAVFLIEGASTIEGQLSILIITYLGLAAVRHLFHYVRWTSSHYKTVKCEKDMRVDLFNKTITQNSIVLARYTSGELMSINNSDVVMVKDIFMHFLPLSIEHFFCVGLAAVFILFINPYLSILPAACGIAMFVISFRYMNVMQKIYTDVRNRSAELNTCVQENINGVRLVRSFAAEPQEIKKFDKRNLDYREAFLKQAKTWSKYQAIFQGLSQLNSIGSITLALVLGLMGNLTIGQFATFGTYIALMSGPMINIAAWLNQLQQAIVAGTRAFTFLETNNIIKDVAVPNELTSTKPNLTMRNTSLTIDEKAILKNIELELPYGKKLGVMGRTGSGKSALLKTMSRFFEPTHGTVEFDNVDIRRIALEDVRRQFGWVMQDVFLFSNTVDSNIAFFNPDATSDDVVFASKNAEANDFILKLTDGYSTIVGERGLGLSGGQKQRVSIARALLKNAPILILDDATSALDLETERRIFENLKTNYPEITMVIAAHRASSVEFCDEIIYLDDGRIVERGTHEELMELDGLYAGVVNSQAVARQEVLS